MRQSTLSAFGPPRPATAPPIDARPPPPLPSFDPDLSNGVGGGETADMEGDPERQGKEMPAPALPPSDNDQRLRPGAETTDHGGPEIGASQGHEVESGVSSWLPRPGPSSSSGEAAPTRSRRAAATRSEAQSRQMTLALNGALTLERKAASSSAGTCAGDDGEYLIVEKGSDGVGATTDGEGLPKRRKRGRPRKDEAAKDKAREINLVDDDEEDEEGKRRMGEARNKKEKKKEREPEKEMSLQVKGNGSSDGKVHSFFAKRQPRPPAGEQTENVAAANQNAFFVAGNGSSSRAAAPSSSVKKRPLMEARWPRSEEMLVEPPLQVQEVLPWSRRFNWPKKEPKDRIHNGLAPEEVHSLPWQHRARALDKGRNESGRSPVTSSKLHPGQLEELVASNANILPSGSSTKLAVKGPTQNRSTNEAWTDRWRPLRADEVLGNEVGATYLRDWIHQLQVSPTASVRSTAKTGQEHSGLSSSPGKSKKRMMQVQKRAEKKRRKKVASRRGGLDGFLVEDEDGEDQVGSWDEGDDEESAWFDQFRTKDVEDLVATANVDEPDETLFANSDRLANVLVLTGPTGSGKTASVYACASELNHEVFEIYPGMGKRSGKELSTAVGDLGRNHMVSSGGTGGGATWKMLDRKETTTIPSNGHSTKPRQSVILIEEVDLLYDEDKGFWAAVVELVAESRRPVILTCNDLSAVPLSDLPIQRVLTFRPPPASIAVPYLQLLCAHEGHLVGRADLENLYTSTQGSAMDRAAISQLTFTSGGRDGGPVNPRMQLNAIDKLSDHESLAALDLRQAINQLQFECQRSSDSTALSNTHPAKAAAPSYRRLMPQQLENRSFFDASIEAPFDRASELMEPDRYLPFATHDELQLPNEMVALPKMKPRPVWAAFPSFAREGEYRFFLSPWNSDEEELLLGRLTTSRKVDEVLGCRDLCLAPSWSAFLGSDHCITDYTSYLCRIVAIDDTAQAQHAAKLARAQEEALKRRQALFEEASAVSGGNQRQLDEEALRSASFSLAKIGIRSTRGSTQMILSGSSDGPGDFVRLLDLDKPILERIREVGSFSM